MQVGDIPYTLNGKRVEVPVKRVSVSFLLGQPITVAQCPALALGPRRVGAGTFRSSTRKLIRGLILDLEWGFAGFIQCGYSSEP